MNCHKLFYIIAAFAFGSGEFADPDLYPALELKELTGIVREEAIILLDKQLANVANLTDGRYSYKAINMASIWGDIVSAKKLTYTAELTAGFVTMECDVRIWNDLWFNNNTNIKINCEGIEGRDCLIRQNKAVYC